MNFSVSVILVFEHMICPVLDEYAPDIILVSAGFDASIGDPLGMLKRGLSHCLHLVYVIRSLQTLTACMYICQAVCV